MIIIYSEVELTKADLQFVFICGAVLGFFLIVLIVFLALVLLGGLF